MLAYLYKLIKIGNRREDDFMNSFWNRATIIETERKNFDSSMRLIDAVVSRINAMNIANQRGQRR